MKSKILAIICLAFVLSSCSEDNDISLNPVAITLNFSHSWDGIEITNADFNELKFTNENEQDLSIERLRYLISEISLTHESGVVTVLDEYNLVDLTNTKGLSFTTSETILPGDYTSVSFRFGFSNEYNIDGAYQDLNTTNFNVPAALGGGYHFMQFDGKYRDITSVEAPFNYHVISAIDPSNTNDPKDTSFSLNIGAATIGGNTNIQIEMDVSEWFKNPTIWNLNEYDINLMGNYDVQLLMNQNGSSVFSLVSITQ
ncbi:MAG: hypothetical protein P8Q53_08345 [Flavobacteriaceae bacterium]|nr:hypothetical protein [Flavobacteriaceae bacterium]MDG2275277.1 hypothetical protein [Flavobacteriaceae bacterium]